MQSRKRKVLIFIEDGSFTFDNRVKREALALIEDGWYVSVISPKYSGDKLYKKYSNNLRSYHYPKPNALSVYGHLVEHFITLVFGSIFTFWVFIRHGFSVFHACNPTDVLWMVFLPYKIFGTKFIFDQHDLCPELYLSRGIKGVGEKNILYRILLLLEYMSYKLANVVISTNESYKYIAMKRGRKKNEDVIIVRNGPARSRFRDLGNNNTNIDKDNISIGYIGNMNPTDSVEIILLIAHHIVHLTCRSDFHFYLIGSGSSFKQLRKLSNKLMVDDHVTFTGRIPDSEVIDILKNCDICIQPDAPTPLNDKSTMNKVMEYMALGKPIITYDLTETRVSCGDAAIYIDKNGGITDFSEKIIFLSENKQLRIKMGGIGGRRVESALWWDYSVPHLLEAYQIAMDQ